MSIYSEKWLVQTRALVTHSTSARLVAVVAFIVFVLFANGPAIRQVDAQDLATHRITVEGVATASRRADVVTFVIGTEAVSTDLQTAVTQVDQDIDTISTTLLQTGVQTEDIEILTLEITPEDLLDTRTGGITGRLYYRVRSAIRVILRDANTLRAIVAAAVNAGANAISDFGYGIEDSTALEEQARADALRNASERAAGLATGLNLELAEPVIISEIIEVNGERASLSPTGFWITGESNGSIVPNAGSIVVTARVTVTYRAHP